LLKRRANQTYAKWNKGIVYYLWLIQRKPIIPSNPVPLRSTGRLNSVGILNDMNENDLKKLFVEKWGQVRS